MTMHRVGWILLVSFASPVAVLAQNTLYVAPCGDDAWTGTLETCVAPSGPKRTIQAAINSAAPGDTVLVAEGLYTGPGNIELNFGGKAITLRSQSGPKVTIIDAGGTMVQPRRAFHFHSGEPATAIVDGLSLQGGWHDRGGALLIEGNSSPTFQHCIFSENTAGPAVPEIGGGAAMISGGSPAFISCEFRNNVVLAITFTGGGALFIHSATPTFTDCIFEGNASGGPLGSGGGGALGIVQSTVLLDNCQFVQNSSTAGGGAIICAESTIEAIACTFHQNEAETHAGAISSLNTSTLQLRRSHFTGNSAPFAGAVYSGGDTPSTLDATDCVFDGNLTPNTGGDNAGGAFVTNLGSMATFARTSFRNNEAGGAGGAIGVNNGNVEFTNCEFVGNTARTFGGGALINNFTQAKFTNCLFAENHSSGDGGAVFMTGGAQATFTNSTLADNSAIQGGGLHLAAATGSVTLANSILWNNLPQQIANFTNTLSVTFSNLQSGPWPGAGNISEDPHFMDPFAGDYSLAPLSPCIDAGENALVPTGTAHDLAGNPRFTSTGLPAGLGIVDMGPYEFQGGICYANCDASTVPPTLNVDDFTCFINAFAAAGSLPPEEQVAHYANCDGSTVAPILNVDDFTCFINAFAAGCP